MPKVNRRELVAMAIAASLTETVLAERALAQNPPATTASGQRDFLAEARTSHRDDAAALAKVDLPQSTEPSFEFRP